MIEYEKAYDMLYDRVYALTQLLIVSREKQRSEKFDAASQIAYTIMKLQDAMYESEKKVSTK